MAIDWPTTLPQSPLREGYSYQDGDGRVATDMQQGPQRFRRLYTNVPRIYSLKFSMSAAEADAFESFYDTTLAGGSIAVNIPVRKTSGNTTVAAYIVQRQSVQVDESDEFIISLQVVTA